MNQPDPQAQALNDSDAGMARVLEDLIDLLINRGLIQFTDLPQSAQDKLLQRNQSRSELSHRLKLLAEEDGGGDLGLDL